MRKWSMTQIVHQTSHRHISHVVLFYDVVSRILSVSLAKLAANVIQEMHLLLRKMADTQAVRKSGVCCAWKHMV